MTEFDVNRQVSISLHPALRDGTCARKAAKGLALALCVMLSACIGTGQAPPRPGAGKPLALDDSQRHHIAMLVPLSGSNAGVGQSMLNTAKLTLSDTNTENLKITSYDTAKGAAQAIKAAVADGNTLILGPLIADDVRTVAPIARAAKIPVISYSNDSTVSGNGVYLMGYTPAQSITRVVTYARSKGVLRFAGLVPRGIYGERAGNALLRAVEQTGGTVTALQTFDHTPASMTAAAKKLLEGNSGYDAVLIADSGRTAMQFAPIIRKNGGANARLLGTELWNTDAEIAANPAMAGAWFASVPDGLYRQLATKYRTRYKASPYRIDSLAYDSVLLVLRIAQTWKLGQSFPANKLVDSGGFTGIDGAFRFRSDGLSERALEVQQISDGKIVVADPAASGFAK